MNGRKRNFINLVADEGGSSSGPSPVALRITDFFNQSAQKLKMSRIRERTTHNTHTIIDLTGDDPEDSQRSLKTDMDVEKAEAVNQVQEAVLDADQEKPDFDMGEVYSTSSESSDAENGTITREGGQACSPEGGARTKTRSLRRTNRQKGGEMELPPAGTATRKAGNTIKQDNPPPKEEKGDEEEQKDEEPWHHLDDWAPSRTDREEQNAAAPEPHQVPFAGTDEPGDNWYAADDDEAFLQNKYFRSLYTAEKHVAVKGLCPMGWTSSHKSSKKLSVADKKEEERQLQSFQSSFAVILRTESMFAKHLLSADSLGLWAGDEQVHIEQQCVACKPGEKDPPGMNDNDPLWDFDNVCNFCVYNFFPTIQLHAKNCQHEGNGVCNISRVLFTADKTQRTVRKFLEHHPKFIPAGDVAIAVPIVQYNLHVAMNARQHLDTCTFKNDPIYVLPAAADMQKVINQAICGANMAEVVRPACAIIGALKKLICQVRPGCPHRSNCHGGHPLYPYHVSMLQYQREFGLDLDWEYEPSFLEFAAVLDRSIFLLEHLHMRVLNNSSALSLGVGMMYGPAIALDFIAAMLCRMRQSGACIHDPKREPYEHDLSTVPLLIKVLFQENVPPTRALRLIIFQAIRLVRLEQAFLHLCEKEEDKRIQAQIYLSRSISLVTGACTMLLVTLDRYTSTHLFWKELRRCKRREQLSRNATLAINVRARDRVYKNLLKDLKGILSADLFRLHKAVAFSPWSEAGFTKASLELISFKHEPVQQLLGKLALAYASQESSSAQKRKAPARGSMRGLIGAREREGLLAGLRMAHLSNRLPMEEILRRKCLAFCSYDNPDVMSFGSESSNAAFVDNVFQSLSSIAAPALELLRSSDRGISNRLFEGQSAAELDVDPVEALIQLMFQMHSR